MTLKFAEVNSIAEYEPLYQGYMHNARDGYAFSSHAKPIANTNPNISFSSPNMAVTIVSEVEYRPQMVTTLLNLKKQRPAREFKTSDEMMKWLAK